MRSEGAFRVFLGCPFAGVADQKAAMEKAKLRLNPPSGGCRVVCLAGLGFCIDRVCRVSTLSEYDLCHGCSAY